MIRITIVALVTILSITSCKSPEQITLDALASVGQAPSSEVPYTLRVAIKEIAKNDVLSAICIGEKISGVKPGTLTSHLSVESEILKREQEMLADKYLVSDIKFINQMLHTSTYRRMIECEGYR